jgi:hypothetical protein
LLNFLLLFSAYHKGENFDSAQGMPLWSYILAILILGYIAIRVWLAIRKDKK